jgi:XRE family aerobic/anaerobic benzoate catabolism transcriptional regulator
MLATVGARVRALRESRGMTRRELSEQSGVSERFLAQLETGVGNISLARFADVAAALRASPAELLDGATPSARRAPAAIALLGVRGAGKSTVGALLAERLGVPFVELDQRIEQTAGLRLGELFELHGEAHYRRLERDELRAVLDGSPIVLATGGSIVSDSATYSLLRERARTVWLRARAEDHWDRVVSQGDRRPMGENPHAFHQLRDLLGAREPLYARAHHVVQTTGRSVEQVVDDVVDALA